MPANLVNFCPMDYWEATELILALPDMERFSSGPGGHTMTLETMKEILRRLNNPERGRHTVHVTGSKEKGSTSTFIAAILDTGGLKTALYTSPHLHEYTERLFLGMKPVSEAVFARGVDEIASVIEDVNQSDFGPVSTFGALNALFFHLCRQHQVQWQIVEVGLGGTHDATNVFEEKDVAVITPISLEHTAILGPTCASIAQDKSGIITPGCTVVLARQRDPAVKEIVADRCKQLDCKLIDVAETYRIHPMSHDGRGQSFAIAGPHGTRNLHTTMLGMHQLDNAATAVAVAEALIERDLSLTDETIARGINSVEVPGRLEALANRPLLVVDGAHNGESMEMMVSGLSRHFDFERCFVILGVHSDKNIKDIVEQLKRLEPAMIIASRSRSHKSMDPKLVAQAASEQGIQTHVTNSVTAAIDLAREFAGADDLVCVTGSLYVVAEAREAILSTAATR